MFNTINGVRHSDETKMLLLDAKLQWRCFGKNSRAALKGLMKNAIPQKEGKKQTFFWINISYFAIGFDTVLFSKWCLGHIVCFHSQFVTLCSHCYNYHRLYEIHSSSTLLHTLKPLTACRTYTDSLVIKTFIDHFTCCLFSNSSLIGDLMQLQVSW